MLGQRTVRVAPSREDTEARMKSHKLIRSVLVAGVILAGCSIFELPAGAAAEGVDHAMSLHTAGNLAPTVAGKWTYQSSALAGSGSSKLSSPRAVVRSPVSALTYYADTGDNRVWAVAASGQSSLLAGDGTTCPTTPGQACGDGGSAIEAQLAQPSGLAVSADGKSLYIADTNANRIRSVDLSSGIIETVAGTGRPGFSGDGGPAAKAQVAMPLDVATDPSGNVYLADTGNNRIRKIDSSGVITTIAGDGLQCEADHNPGCGAGGPASQAQLAGPSGVSFSTQGATANSLLVADTNSHSIRRIDSAGNFGTVIGNGKPGEPVDGMPVIVGGLSFPRRAVEAFDGSLIVSDTGNQQLVFISPDHLETWQVSASSPAITEPWGVLGTDSGFVYADASHDQIVSLTSPTGPSVTWDSCGPDQYPHSAPEGIVTGTLYQLPGATTVVAQAWGAAGGDAPTQPVAQDNPAPPAGSRVAGGAGGYARTVAPVVEQPSRRLAIVLGCQGLDGSPSPDFAEGQVSAGGGGGATVVVGLDDYVAGSAPGSTYVVAGGGGGAAGPNCIGCSPTVKPVTGQAGGNGADVGGVPQAISTQPTGGEGNGAPGEAVGPVTSEIHAKLGSLAVARAMKLSATDAAGSLEPMGPAQYGFGGPGGTGWPIGIESGTLVGIAGGWGPQWCASNDLCIEPDGAGGSGVLNGVAGGGGGGGAGGGAGGSLTSHDGANQYSGTAAGTGGGSWAMCTDTTKTPVPSAADGSVTVQLGSQSTSSCIKSAVAQAPPKNVVVPNVTWQKESDAIATLQAVGLAYSEIENSQPVLDVVATQIPAAGKVVPPGSTVTISIY